MIQSVDVNSFQVPLVAGVIVLTASLLALVSNLNWVYLAAMP